MRMACKSYGALPTQLQRGSITRGAFVARGRRYNAPPRAAACRHDRRPPHAPVRRHAARVLRAAAAAGGTPRCAVSELQYRDTNGYIEAGPPDAWDPLRAGRAVQRPDPVGAGVLGREAARGARGGDGQRGVPRGAGAGDAADRVRVPRGRRQRRLHGPRRRAPAAALPLDPAPSAVNLTRPQ